MIAWLAADTLIRSRDKTGEMQNEVSLLLTNETKINGHFCEIFDGHGSVILMRAGSNIRVRNKFKQKDTHY